MDGGVLVCRRTLAFLFEGQLTLLVVVFVLSTTPVLTTLLYDC